MYRTRLDHCWTIAAQQSSFRLCLSSTSELASHAWSINTRQMLTCVLSCKCCVTSIASVSTRQKKRTDLGNIIMRTRPVLAKAPPMVSGTQMKGFLIACSASDMHKHTDLTVAFCCSIICNKLSCQDKWLSQAMRSCGDSFPIAAIESHNDFVLFCSVCAAVCPERTARHSCMAWQLLILPTGL